MQLLKHILLTFNRTSYCKYMDFMWIYNNSDCTGNRTSYCKYIDFMWISKSLWLTDNVWGTFNTANFWNTQLKCLSTSYTQIVLICLAFTIIWCYACLKMSSNNNILKARLQFCMLFASIPFSIGHIIHFGGTTLETDHQAVSSVGLI